MSLIPSGALPMCILAFGALNLATGITCFASPSSLVSLYDGVPGPYSPQFAAVLSRIFGTLNLMAACIRLYAPYHLENPELYSLTMVTFAFPSIIFSAEMWYYRTSSSFSGKWRSVAMGMLAVWMFVDWGKW